MSILRELLVRIRGDSSSLTKATNEAKGSLGGLKETASNVGGYLRAGLAAAVGAVGVAMVAAARSAVRYGSDLEDMAKSMGSATTTLAGLRYAAEQAGVGADQFMQSLNVMRRNIADAVVNGGALQGTLNSIGLSAKNLANLSPDEQFRRIVEALGELPQGAQRVNAAFAIFGRGAGGIIPMLDEGIGQLDKMQAAAERLGIALNEVEAQRLADLGDKGDSATAAMQGLANTVGLELVPYLNLAADASTDFLVGAAGYVRDLHDGFRALGAGIVYIVTGAMAKAASVVNTTIKGIKGALNFIPGVNLDASKGGLEGIAASAEAVSAQAGTDFGDLNSGRARKRQQAVDKKASEAIRAARTKTGKVATGVEPAGGGKAGASTAKDDKPEIKWLDEFDSKWEQTFRKARETFINNMAPVERGFARYAEEIENAKKSGEEWAQTTEKAMRGMEDAFVDLAMTGKLQMGDLFKSIQADIARTLIRQNITGPLAGALGSATSSIFGSIFGAAFGGGKANGGPVAGGTPYLIGERGPELFIPNSGGTIVPNHAMGGATVNITNNYSLGVQQTVRQEIEALMPRMQAQAQAGTLAAIERGGNMARSVGRR